MTSLQQLDDSITCRYIVTRLPLRDLVSLALTANKFAWLMRSSFLWRHLTPVQLNLYTEFSPRIIKIQGLKERLLWGIPEPTLSFLLRLAEEAGRYNFQSQEHRTIVDTIFDTLFTLYPGRIFPIQEKDNKISQIFEELKKRIDLHPNSLNHLSLKIEKVCAELTPAQEKRFLTYFSMQFSN